jgi:glycosyltransferase involved in cell wall biosynthesis
MNILMIGSDAAAKGDRASFIKKLEGYTKDGDSVTYILMRNEENLSLTGERVKLFASGGKVKVTTLFKTIRLLLSIIKKEKFDIVTTQDPMYTGLLGFIAKKKQDIPLVIQIHGDNVDNPLWLKQSKLRPFENRLAHFLLRRSEGVRTVSNKIISDIKKYTQKEAKLLSVPIGTNFESFYPNEPISFPRKPTLLFVGRLIEEKNPLLFVDVARELLLAYPEMNAKFAGRGDMEHILKEEFEKSGLSQRVEFMGQCSPSLLRTLYQNSLCYVHTALWEGWGMPMIESLGCGCPVVTTPSGCAGEAVLDGKNGFVIPATKEVFVEAIEKLYKDQELQKNLSEYAYKNVKEWSIENLTKKFLGLLKDVSEKKAI